MTVEWRDIPGKSGFYQASSEGRVRSLDRVTYGRNKTTRTVKGRLLAERVNPVSGYIQSVISLEGKVTYEYNHRLVCLAFHGEPIDPAYEACHYDNDRSNNRPENLRWDSRSNNHADKLRHGTNHVPRKLTMQKAREIRSLRSQGVRVQELADRYGVTQSNISMIIRNTIWKESA